jgi:hypothetical protein
MEAAMKCEVRLENNKLLIRLDAENQMESAKLFEAANACKVLVPAHGYMTDEKTFVWFNIPLVKNRSRSFGNRK